MAKKKQWESLTETGKLRRLSKSKYYSDYKKERDRIKRQMNRMEQRGYVVPEQDILPPIPKKLTQGSINRLRKITTKKMYDASDFVELTETGDIKRIVPGRVGREIERSKSARKGVQTKQKRDREQPVSGIDTGVTAPAGSYKSTVDDWAKSQIDKWKKEQKLQDAVNVQRMLQDPEYADQFRASEQLRRKVTDLMDSIRATYPRVTTELQMAIEEATRREGYNSLWERLSDTPEFLDAVEDYKYKESDQVSPAAFNQMLSKIQNRPLSGEQARNLEEAHEQDTQRYSDIDIDEQS